jgi:hypothetical protein
MDQNLTIFLAPFCIIVGGGLIAFGRLTLFGLDYSLRPEPKLL